ncbi:hypothetical protein [Pseudomonas typographi]|nr:hypothetical protein [Pseudomonas typographi]
MADSQEHPDEFKPDDLPRINDPGNEDPGSEMDDAQVPLLDEEAE